MTALPVLYSFRRCPYAMRARMALWISGNAVNLREVKLANKPDALREASPKATVPVLQRPDGTVLEESLDIMRWALGRSDPEGWLPRENTGLIKLFDGAFKHHLDRYKYPNRYEDEPDHGPKQKALDHRGEGLAILSDLDGLLSRQAHIGGEQCGFTDIALFPFIRQFANTDRDWFDAQPIPHVQAWLEDHLASDLFQSVMVKYAVWQPGDEPVVFGP